MRPARAVATLERRASHLRYLLDDWKGKPGSERLAADEHDALETALPLMRAACGPDDPEESPEVCMFRAYDAILAAAERFAARGDGELSAIARRLAKDVADADPKRVSL